MEAFHRYQSGGYAPSAPSLSATEQHQQHQQTSTPASSSSSGYAYGQTFAPLPTAPLVDPPYGYGAAYGVGAYFPPGTHPWVIRSFQAVDRDGSGSIDETELHTALSAAFQEFSLPTVRLLMFLFKNPSNPLKLGPAEFVALLDCLGQWRAIFKVFDRDRSGKMDSTELRDALFSLGYAVPGSVIQVLISKYDDGSGRKGELTFGSFVECVMVVKGLTEKFKEKDTRCIGFATLSYDTFMSMVIPFLVA